jgi:hypothetical protein
MPHPLPSHTLQTLARPVKRTRASGQAAQEEVDAAQAAAAGTGGEVNSLMPAAAAATPTRRVRKGTATQQQLLRCQYMYLCTSKASLPIKPSLGEET